MRAGIAGNWIFQITHAIWAVVAIASLVVVIASAIPRYHQLAEVTPDAALVTGQLRPFEAQALENVGLSVQSYAVYFTWLEMIISIAFLLIGVLIFWRRPDEWMPLIFSLALVCFGMISSPLTTSLESANPVWSNLLIFLRTVALTSLILAFLLFPDGRFVPPWAVWLGIVWVAYMLLSLLVPDLRFASSIILENQSQMITFSWALLWLLILVGIQVYRYRHGSTPVQRQQTKWVVFGLAIGVTTSAVTSVILLFLPLFLESTSTILIIRLVGITVLLLSSIFMSVTFAVAVLRSHLWDIDILIRRTLVYGALTLTLALVYLGSVVLLQKLFTAVSGQRSAIAVVASTLLIAAISAPLRRRIQHDIDRRFYRKKYNAEKTIAAFSAELRQEVNLEQIGERLLVVVDETMQPESLSLWISPTKGRGPNTANV